MTETMQEYIKRYKDLYSKFEPTRCDVLSVTISFTSIGFKHLIFKGSHRRANHVIKSRLRLLSLSIPVLRKATIVVETRTQKENHNGKEVKVRYDAVEGNVGKGNIRVRVVIRTIGDKGKPHFYSIMRY
jgi:hypothetical protein